MGATFARRDARHAAPPRQLNGQGRPRCVASEEPGTDNEEYRRNQHRAAAGGISGILVTLRAEVDAAAGASTEWSEGEAGPNAPDCEFRIGR